MSRRISEVEATLRQFRLSNDKKTCPVPEPSTAPSPTRGQLKQAREALDYLANRVFEFMTIVT